MGRKLERRHRKKSLQRGEMIPGVPSFLHGGVAHAGANPFLDFSSDFANQNFLPGSPVGGQSAVPSLLPTNTPGVLWDPVNQQFVPDPNFGGDGGGAAGPSFRPGELELLREQFEAQQEQFQLDLELRRLTQKQNNAIAQGNLALARQTERRIAEIQRRQQQLEASLGRAQGIAGIASSRGNIEAQRAQFLSQLAANPRDFAQLNIGLGGGQSFLGNILSGQQAGGQSTALIGGTPTLGADFQRLLQSITARPDVPLFEEAADLFRNVPQFRKGGRHMVTKEPIVGIGMLTGRPQFTLGEPAPGFPLGKPEDVEFSADGRQMDVTPLQTGGSVTFQDIANDISTGRINVPASSPSAGAATPPSPPAQSGFQFPDFPGIGQLLQFLFQGSPLQQAQQGGAGAIELGQAVQQFQESIPRTPGAAIRRLMSGLNQQSFSGLLPSQVGLLESVVSALGVPPQDFTQSLLRAFPTGPNPAAISFGNFSEGGTIIAGVGARPVAA